MGLDGVEVLMEVEETFGIEFTDAAAGKTVRVSDIVDYVVSQVPTSNSSECITQRLFYRLRRGFRTQLAALSEHFDPDTPLRGIVNKQQWPRAWKAIRRAVGEPGWPENIPWPGFFRRGPKTVRQLIWHVLKYLPRPDVKVGERWTRARIAAEVCRIISEQLNIRKVRLRDRLVADLGLE